MKRVPAALAVAIVCALPASAQDASLEYRVKAAYLFNFTKFVDWPPGAIADGAPFTICVAGTSPFVSALEDTMAVMVAILRSQRKRQIGMFHYNVSDSKKIDIPAAGGA